MPGSLSTHDTQTYTRHIGTETDKNSDVIMFPKFVPITLTSHDPYGVLNLWQLDSLFNSLFGSNTKETQIFRITGIPSGNRWFPSQRASNAESGSMPQQYSHVRVSQYCYCMMMTMITITITYPETEI